MATPGDLKAKALEHYADLGLTGDDYDDIAKATALVDQVADRMKERGSPLRWCVVSAMAPPEQWPQRTEITEGPG